MNQNNNLKNISSTKSTQWKEKAAFRKQNKWLEYSSQIARRIIAVIRNKEDLNQTKLADLVGVSPQQISKIIKGHENLTLETIYKLSQALGTPLIEFPEYEYSKNLSDTTSRFNITSALIMVTTHDSKDNYTLQKAYLGNEIYGWLSHPNYQESFRGVAKNGATQTVFNN